MNHVPAFFRVGHFGVVRFVALLILGLSMATSLQAQPGQPPLPRRASLTSGLTVDPSDRVAAVQFYRDQYVMTSSPAPGWTGAVAGCVPGTTSAVFQAAVARRINYFRAMAGVPAGVVFAASLNTKAQAAALMMSANNNLSHTPPTTWDCYSSDGVAGAGSSNLVLAVGWDAISIYMADPGASNSFAGHRRWILYPPTQQMGTGDIPAATGQSPANALTVFGGTTSDPAPSIREATGFVAWPPRGYVPYPVVYPRWSFAYPNADFSTTVVTMRDVNNAPVTLTQQPVVNGFGTNTLVWEPALSGNGFDGSPPSTDLPFDVTVSNVQIAGQARTFTYRVTVIDPATTKNKLVYLPSLSNTVTAP